jgi:SAM-dependent methyltransferase
MGRYYPETYEPFAEAPERERSWLRRLDRRRGIENLCRPVTAIAGPTGLVLDVGCATGNFLAGMRELGWETIGVEPSPHAASYAREVQGLDVHQGTLADAALPAEHVDVVTMWHVLEHVYDPKASLAEAARVLRPGGWIVITVPHLESWEARCFGRYWLGLDFPRHLYLFSRPVLRRYLAEASLAVVKEACITGRHVGLTTSLRFWSTDWPLPVTTRRRLMAAVESPAVRLPTWPYYTLAGKLGRASFLTTFARKGAAATGSPAPREG